MKEILKCGKCKKYSESNSINKMARYQCKHCKTVNEILDISIQEWLGFNYRKYLQLIKQFIDQYNYPDLTASTQKEIDQGYLTPEQVIILKKVLKNNFDEGNTIQQIKEDIIKKVEVQNLNIEEEDQKLHVPADVRAISIARTETTRAANEGSRTQYKESEIKQYTWVAAVSDRTCPLCLELNGQNFPVNSQQIPPAHSLCRCTIIPVITT